VKTAFSELVGIEFPVAAFSHCRDVVAAVSRAGGLGVFGAAHTTPARLEVELSWIEAHAGGRPYAVDVLVPAKHAGENETELLGRIPVRHREFMQELTDRFAIPPRKPEGTHDFRGLLGSHERARANLEVALDHQVKVLASALGPFPRDIVDEAHRRGKLVAGLVGRTRHAVRQVEAGADIVVAVGAEAGGHTGTITTMVLVPEIVDAVRPVPVLAAGGIGSGRQLAAAFALGAQGAWTGSIWLTSSESAVDPMVQEKLLAAGSGDTTISRSQSGKPIRMLRTAWSDAWNAPDAPEPLEMPLQGLLVRDAITSIFEHRVEPLMGSSVGQIVGRMKEIRSCRAILLDMMEDFVEASTQVGAFAEGDSVQHRHVP
jgi:NAD(P)H-dependent flavin oxidoreductase YrpB (nitropropane dioxygenase family)